MFLWSRDPPPEPRKKILFPKLASRTLVWVSKSFSVLEKKRKGEGEGTIAPQKSLKKTILLTIYRKGMRLIFLNQDKDIVR